MLCPRRYGIPRIAIVPYYLMRDNQNCAPGSKNVSRPSPASGLKTFSIPQLGKDGSSQRGGWRRAFRLFDLVA
jgi:hypothetical protein